MVSVIVPCYNSEKHIAETLDSVTRQTLDDMEVLVVDDCSTDGSLDLIEAIAGKDGRFRVFSQDKNRGVAAARNLGLKESRGRYIAYLDADDIWSPEKLERQISVMSDRGFEACFTSYETIEEDGRHRNTVHVPSLVDYKGLLKNTLTCSHTLVIDTHLVEKDLLIMPDIRRGQDFATWLQVLKAGHRFHGLDIPLAKYRKTAGSLSSNPIKAVRRTWNVYRNIEHLPVLYAAYCQLLQVCHALAKRRSN